MNKQYFSQLLEMGYSPLEALDLLNGNAQPEETVPEPETEPAPAPAPTPEPEQEVPSVDPLDAFRAEMKDYQDSINAALDDLKKVIQRNNIRTIGTDDDPAANRAEEFLSELVKGRK